MKDAYYSATGDYHVGHAVYLDDRGAEVKCSEVCEVGHKPTSKWPDMRYVGQVVTFVRAVDKLPEMPPMYAPTADHRKWIDASLARINEHMAERN